MADSLLDVDFELLAKRGIKYVAFDADSTLVPSRGKLLDSETEAFLKKHRARFSDWCIAATGLQTICCRWQRLWTHT
jgi:predicted HAD superfamily phosphohydrolase YqeG